MGGYVKIPAETFTRFRDDIDNGTFLPNEYEFVMLSRGKTFEQKDRGEMNPDLLIDSEAITMEKASFPDRPADTLAAGSDFDPQRYDGTNPWCLYKYGFWEVLLPLSC